MVREAMKPFKKSIGLPKEADRRCTNCGATVQPFGELRQWFCVNQDALLCLSCARKVIPDQVAIAETFELYNNESGGKTTSH